MDLDTLRRVFLLQREGKGGNVKAGPDKPLRGITQTGFDFGLNSCKPKSDYSRGLRSAESPEYPRIPFSG